jgi:hypothetical protein
MMLATPHLFKESDASRRSGGGSFFEKGRHETERAKVRHSCETFTITFVRLGSKWWK